MHNRLIASRSLLLPRERRKRRFRVFIIGWMLVATVRISEAQDFRIDNQLRIATNDCYTRIAIGSRLPDSNVTSTLPAVSLANCERACSGNRTICNSFSFGIDAKGNGTCALGRRDLNMKGRDLVVDPDYDVYERRPKMPRGCHHDRLLRIGYGSRILGGNSTNAGGQMDLNMNLNPTMNMNMNPNVNMNMNPNMNMNMNMNSNMNMNMNPNTNQNMNPSMTPNMNTNTGTGRRPQSPFGSRFLTGISLDNLNPQRRPSFIRGGWYSPLADDTDTRLYDILTNKNSKPNFWMQSFHHPLHDVQYPQEHVLHSVDESILGFNDHYGHRSTPIGTKWNQVESVTSDSKWNFPFPEVDPYPKEDSFTTPTDSPEHETRGLFEHGVEFEFPGTAGTDPILEKTKPCYRKLLVGKRLSDSHVRRSVRCERIEDCHRVCEYESAFVCEGFNYGRMQNVGRAEREGYMCQLTSTSGSRMDLGRDFVADPRWDYYERDWRCPAEKPSSGGSAWPIERPVWPARSSLPPVNRPTSEILQPQRRPLERYPDAVGDTRYYFPEKARPPINRPGDYDYYPRPSGYLPERPAINVHYQRPLQRPQYIPEDRYRPPINPPRPHGGFPKYPDRRLDQNGWPISESRPNEIPHPDRNWRKPGGSVGSYGSGISVYGPSYGYHTSPGNVEPPRRIGDSYSGGDIIGASKPARRPANQHRYGYNYGPAYGYGGHDGEGRPPDSYIPSWKPQRPQRPSWMSPGSWGGSRDCSVRSATGVKLARKCVEASYTTANLEECEMLCASRNGCLSFAYRYSLAATAPTDNCLLSSAKFEKLDFYVDLEPDRDYDIYAMMSNSWNCQGSRKPTTQVQPHDRPTEECFWRVRSGFNMPRSLTREEFRAENGIGECQTACVSARHFTCRSFVFRYDWERDRGPNCFLSDCPTREIISAAGGGQIDDAELYERGSYGRGCEPYPFATIYGPADVNKQSQWTGSGTRIVNRGDEGSCYSGYPDGCKLSPYAVSSVTRTDSETECRRKCSKMRNNQHTPCMSFSYKVGDEKRGDNCYLSDVPRRDLRPGLDYTLDDDYVTYAWKELEPQCSPIGPAGHPSHGFHGFYQDPANNAVRPPGSASGLLTFNHLLLGVRPLESGEPDPLGPSADYPSTTSQSHQNDDGYIHQNGFASFNQYFTVNGYPCKRGTKCERNKIVGFWSCEPEGAELGSWDYCCEPSHHCGYSQGYRYPWCYVGPSEDQWRPCSDKYYPYLPSPRPAVSPPPQRPNDHGPLGHDAFQPPDSQDSSTYHSRHWPIAFLHPIPPPNATTAGAPPSDRRDDQHATANASSTVKTTPRSAENSTITRVQLHKSHLQRRGLTANRTRAHRPKSSEQRIQRIVIIPTKIGDGSADLSQTFDYSATTEEEPAIATEAARHNGGAETERDDGKNDLLDFSTSATSTTDGRFGSGHKSSRGLGRIERVTKPTRGTGDSETSRRDGIVG